jgi:predicted dehydrogenase
MEAMWTRFIPAVAEAKRRIDTGALGRVRYLQGNFAYPVLQEPGSRFFDPIGGGALLDRGVYLISLAQYFLGTPQASRGTAYVGFTGVDEQSTYQLRYGDGALANFAASFQFHGTNDLILCGERGRLRLCDPFYRAHRLIFEPASVPAKSARVVANKTTPRAAVKSVFRRLSPLREFLARRSYSAPFAGNGYHFEIAHASDCLREQRTESPVMPLSDSIEVLRIMDALRSDWQLSSNAARVAEGIECQR